MTSTASSSRVRVYMACSLDGFIAGPDHDVSWLEEDLSAPGDLEPDPAAVEFDDFMAEVGAMLMGRSTYEVVVGFNEWPYDQTPVLVATRRPLEPVVPTVRRVEGDIVELVAQAKAAAGPGDVYLDGGDLIRQALDADLVDELIVTRVPVLLGAGTRLYEGVASRKRFQFVAHRPMRGGMLQVTLRAVR